MLTKHSTLQDVAMAVAEALRKAGVDAVLTGGACATVYTGGAYQSKDLDFIVKSPTATQQDVDKALKALGFRRESGRYLHSKVPYFVEFPAGPLAIGADYAIRPVRRRDERGEIQLLSATDACRDRLAAFYHWNDRSSLNVAVEIAAKNRVLTSRIRSWSEREGFLSRFEEFQVELKRNRRAKASLKRRR